MISRTLPPEEWPRLEGTEAGAVWQTFNPENTVVTVVEKDGKIVGVWTALRVVMMECLWIVPEERGSFGVAKRLLRGMRDVARKWGAKVVYTGSATRHLTHQILRFGGVPSPPPT